MTTTTTLDLYTPYTTTLSRSLPDSGRARNGYVCYATAGCPSNSASYGPGSGDSPREAAQAATYWANQAPWVRVVPWSRAPCWAIDWAGERSREDY